MQWSRGWKRTAVALLVLALGLVAGDPAHAQTPKYSLGILGKYTADGMLIQTVTPGSPSDRIGLQPGDVILKMDGQLIQNQDDLLTVLNSSGGTVLLIVRKTATNRIVRLSLDLGGKGIQAPYLLGVIGTYTPDGMRIAIVVPGTAAARIGLQPGDVIGRINNQVVRSQNDLYAVLNTSGGSASLLVRKGANGRVVRLDADLATYQLGALGTFTRDGMLIATVAPGTPAERAGLQPGDVIGRIDNQVIRNQKDYSDAINNSGGSVTLLVRKGGTGAVGRLFVDLMNNPLGAWCEPGADGMRITAVAAGTPAERLGLQRGDVILRIDDERVRSQNDLLQALSRSGGLVSLVVRKGQSGRLVRLDADLTR